MTGYKKRTVILVISLIALLGLAGCGQSGGGNGSGENLTKEQKIDKGLDAFYNLDDGKVQIEAKTDYIRHQPSEGQKAEGFNKYSYKGTFEMGPVRARGKLNYANDSKKGSREIYGTDGAEYKKEKGDKAWKQDIYTSKWRNQPTGFNRDFIAFLQTKKKDITVKEDKKTYTLRFETTDMKLLDENGDLFFGAMFRPIIVSSTDDTGKLVAELTVSKEDNKPLSFKYTGNFDSSAVSAKFKGVAKYSDQNTGVRVEEPKGIDKAKGY